MRVESEGRIIPKLVTVKEAAAALTLSPWTIRDWIAKGILAHVRLGRRLAVPISEVERLVQEGTVGRSSTSRDSNTEGND